MHTCKGITLTIGLAFIYNLPQNLKEVGPMTKNVYDFEVAS